MTLTCIDNIFSQIFKQFNFLPTEVLYFSDGSPAVMRTASKGKTAKKKTKGDEGKLFMIHSLTEVALNLIQAQRNEHCIMYKFEHSASSVIEFNVVSVHLIY